MWKALFGQGASAQARHGRSGRTALMFAAEGGHLSVIKVRFFTWDPTSLYDLCNQN